eukprot:SAG22_NODE_649_length_8157_cov_30.400099_3_plen_350_part_00
MAPLPALALLHLLLLALAAGGGSQAGGGLCDAACGIGDGCACFHPYCCEVCSDSDQRYCKGRGQCIDTRCHCDAGYAGNRCQLQPGSGCPWRRPGARPWAAAASTCTTDGGCGGGARANNASAAAAATPGPANVFEIWVVRHGQAEHNADRVNGWKIPDPALTALGRRQAREAALALPDDLELVVASPLRRCIETARPAIAGQRLGRVREAGPVLHPDLQELYVGPADTGRPAAELEETEQPVTLTVLRGRPQWEREKGLAGFNLGDPAGRGRFGRAQAGRFLEWLLGGSRPERRVLVVGHRGALEWLLPDRPALENAEVRFYRLVDDPAAGTTTWEYGGGSGGGGGVM